MKIFVFLFIIFGAQFLPAQSAVQLQTHQKKAIDYLVEHPEIKGLLVNHYMGTGKTFLAIGFAERFQNQSILVIAPRFIEGHWRQQLKQFQVRNSDRFEFVSYHQAASKLQGRDLSNTILILDEAHNLVKLMKSVDSKTSKSYADLYLELRKAKRILALSGTPVYSEAYDLAPLLNLVSGEDLLPYNEEEFRLKFTEVKPGDSYGRGYFTESMILRAGTPSVLGFGLTSLFGPFGLLGGFIVGTCIFPIVNWLTPIKKDPLRRLNAEKLSEISSKYISFYEVPDLDLSQYPSEKRHIEEVNYNPEQFEMFLNFAAMGLNPEQLAVFLREDSPDLSLDYIKLNSTTLQKHLRGTYGAGREIGNLGAASPKFDAIYRIIAKNTLQQTVIYSNYYENGILLFAKYLDAKGLSKDYGILKPDLNSEQQSQIVGDYNSGKIKILLLHPEITEGISLKNTRQFHVLEPLLTQTALDQVVARSVRYQSHANLPANERRVDVYLWESTIGSWNLKNFELKKADWLKRYRELNDWSDYGIGITQVDPNYYFKKYSPDETVINELGNTQKDIVALKDIFSQYSVESAAKVAKTFNPREEKALPYPTTNFTVGYFFAPTVRALGGYGTQTPFDLKPGLSYRLGFEMPLYRYLSAGAYVNYVKYALQDPNKDASLYNIGTGVDLKTQFPIEFGSQRLAPYLTGSVGIGGLIDFGVIPDQFKIGGGTRPDVFGLGFSGQLMAGLEYYPVPMFGIFIQGGMGALVGLNRLSKSVSYSCGDHCTGSKQETSWDMASYWLQAWEVQFGLKLGF